MMKISTMIKKLEAVKERRGDVNVYVHLGELAKDPVYKEWSQGKCSATMKPKKGVFVCEEEDF